MNKTIYADNAATTRMDNSVLDAMMPYLTSEYGNPSQPYSLSIVTKKAIDGARRLIAKCINARPDEIFFTSGGSESDNWAIKGLFFKNFTNFEVITSEIEHDAVLNSCNFIKDLGATVKIIKPSTDGVIDVINLKQIISNNTDLVSIMFINNEIGSIQPIKELAQIAHEHGAIFHTDAVQAIGHIPIDVQELGIDLLSASAHKFFGPRGIGFLYIRKGIEISPLIDGGSQERKMRAGTENVASIVGMARALDISTTNLTIYNQHLIELRTKFISELLKIDPSCRINESHNSNYPGIINISFKNIEGEMILHRLDLRGIIVSTGSACHGGKTSSSHVLKSIGVPEEYINGSIRISFSPMNTFDDVIVILKELSKILNSRC